MVRSQDAELNSIPNLVIVVLKRREGMPRIWFLNSVPRLPGDLEQIPEVLWKANIFERNTAPSGGHRQRAAIMLFRLSYLIKRVARHLIGPKDTMQKIIMKESIGGLLL